MADLTFRLGLTPLEDRTTPALSPQQVFDAAAQTASTQALMERVAARPPELVNAFTKAFLNQYLPTLTVQSQQNAAVLAEYQNELVGQMAENPGLTPFVGRVSQARFTAETNAFRGGALTTAFGGIPIRTVAPTPATLTTVAIPQVFDTRLPGDPAPTATDFTSAAGLVDTIPDLNSPFFTAVGDQGLRIEDVVQGVGAPLTGQETAPNFFYTGYLAADGTKFNDFRTEPVPFNLAAGVIPGFQQGLIGLRPGGVRRLDIPSELAYGEAGQGESIPPNARLVFEVKLLGQPPATNTGGFGGNTGGFGGNTGGTGIGAGNIPIVLPGGGTGGNTNTGGTGAGSGFGGLPGTGTGGTGFGGTGTSTGGTGTGTNSGGTGTFGNGTGTIGATGGGSGTTGTGTAGGGLPSAGGGVGTTGNGTSANTGPITPGSTGTAGQ